MTTAVYTPPRTLGDLIPRTNSKAVAIAINIGLMLSFALLTAATAQFYWKLSYTPVPITGQTFAVLLSGAALGWRMGAGSQIMYILLGMVFPFYSHGSHGYNPGTSYTFGYLIGFIFAAALVGYLAEKGNDRKVLSAIGSFFVGSLVVYGFGVIWLAHELNMPVFNGPNSGLANGLYPFLIGDVVKLSLAGALLPATWAIVKKVKPEKSEPSEG